jgi:Leucine-rich repeat (LRR) protein
MSLTILEYCDPEELHCNRGFENIYQLEIELKLDTIIDPENIYKLVNLELLDLTDNSIEDISPEISNLTNLETLNLTYNGITEIIPEMCQLPNLSSLYLGYNGVTSIPSEICTLANLTELLLNDNCITAFPSELCQLINLSLLCLNNNTITEIPPEIYLLTNLKELYINNNNLIEIPSELFQLTNLSVLELTNNNIKNIATNNITANKIYDFLSNIYDLKIYISSYSSHMDPNCEILIFYELCSDLTKLLPNIKTCYLSKEKNHQINVPSTCEIIYFENIKKNKLMYGYNDDDTDDDDDDDNVDDYNVEL